jgi:hypothetical protein
MALSYSPDWFRRVKATGYFAIYCPDHPAAWDTGYAFEHRLVAERTPGRPLLPHEVVHHRNYDKHDNAPENLVVLSLAQHRRVRVAVKGGLG